MNELYKQEILELTELLRSDEDWEDLRNILIENGANLEQIALVSFIEDEEENDYGVIVTKDIKIIKYLRTTQNGKNKGDNFKLKDITNEKEEINKYPQIYVAIDMIRNQELV